MDIRSRSSVSIVLLYLWSPLAVFFVIEAALAQGEHPPKQSSIDEATASAYPRSSSETTLIQLSANKSVEIPTTPRTFTDRSELAIWIEQTFSAKTARHGPSNVDFMDFEAPQNQHLQNLELNVQDTFLAALGGFTGIIRVGADEICVDPDGDCTESLPSYFLTSTSLLKAELTPKPDEDFEEEFEGFRVRGDIDTSTIPTFGVLWSIETEIEGGGTADSQAWVAGYIYLTRSDLTPVIWEGKLARGANAHAKRYRIARMDFEGDTTEFDTVCAYHVADRGTYVRIGPLGTRKVRYFGFDCPTNVPVNLPNRPSSERPSSPRPPCDGKCCEYLPGQGCIICVSPEQECP